MRRSLIGLLASLLVSTVSAAPIVEYAPGETHTRIVVKLKAPAANVAMARSASNTNTLSFLQSVSARLGSEVTPLFGHDAGAARASATASSEVVDAASVLKRYMSIPLPATTSEQTLRAVLADIKRQADVEVVYAEPLTLPAVLPADAIIIAPPMSLPTPDLSKKQTHLSAINHAYVAGLPGGKGDNVSVIDVEYAWTLDHEDLPSLRYNLNRHAQVDNQAFRDHGTGVLGVIAARENGIGVNGIAPNASIGVSAYSGSYDQVLGTPEAIKAAADVLKAGDVLLIEAHRGTGVPIECACNQEQCSMVAVEYWDADFDAIQYATKKGINVVEAAGNGSVNLNRAPFLNKLSRTNRDSGAIIVGASQSTSRAPACYSNSGSMVDVNAWGEQVTTTGYGDLHNGGRESQAYTANFSGTSSASAIVAGAVASLQGIAKANQGAPISPLKMRELLVKSGTPQTGELSRPIGTALNLKSAADLLLGTSSGNVGTPQAGINLTLRSHREGQNVPLNRTQRLVVNVTVPSPLTVRSVNAKYLSQSATMTRNSNGSYSITWTPRTLGKATLSFTATDSKGAAKSLTLNVNVTRY